MTKRSTRPGILAGPVAGPERIAALYPPLPAGAGGGLVHRGSGFSGTFLRFDADHVVVRGDLGQERRFRNEPGTFSVDGIAVRLGSEVVATDTPETRGF